MDDTPLNTPDAQPTAAQGTTPSAGLPPAAPQDPPTAWPTPTPGVDSAAAPLPGFAGYGVPGYAVPGYPADPYQATGQPAGPPWPPTRAPLVRSRSDRMFGGVCGGLARYWNTDPVLLRILAVVITLFTGGAFLVAYLIAWLVIPDEAAVAGYPPGPGSPVVPRERSYLGWLVVSAAILVAGLLGLLAVMMPLNATLWGVAGGIMLTILGIGLLVGTTRGRARWLVLPAIPLALVTFGVVSAGNWVEQNPDWNAVATRAGADGLTAGTRTWTVTPAQAKRGNLEYNLTLGEATLDLRELSAPNDGGGRVVPIQATVGLGQLTVLLPRDVELRLDANVRAGEIVVPTPTGGADTAPLSGENLTLTRTLPARTESPTYIIELAATIGAGQLEVRRAAS